MEETTKIAKWRGDKDSMRQVLIRDSTVIHRYFKQCPIILVAELQIKPNFFTYSTNPVLSWLAQEHIHVLVWRLSHTELSAPNKFWVWQQQNWSACSNSDTQIKWV